MEKTSGTAEASQGSNNNSHSLTSEQIISDLTDAPYTDVVFVTQPPGTTNETVSETDQIVRDCVRLVTAYQSLHSSDTGLDSLPKIASAVEECSEELRNAISSTTDR